jgi:hypothetical protein
VDETITSMEAGETWLAAETFLQRIKKEGCLLAHSVQKRYSSDM